MAPTSRVPYPQWCPPRNPVFGPGPHPQPALRRPQPGEVPLQNGPKTANKGPNRPHTALRGSRTGSVTLHSLFGAQGRLFGDRGTLLRPLRRSFGSVLCRFGPDVWRNRRARHRNRKMAVTQAGRPESRFRGHFSLWQPRRTGPPYGQFGAQNGQKRSKTVCPKMIPDTLERCTGHI